MTPVEIEEADGPVVLGLPHTGTWLPDDVRASLNETGLALADTDWHVDLLYDGLLPGATTVRATFHRYVIDANRSPDDASLYPGRNTTGLCPLTDFDGRPIWNRGAEPTPEDVAARRAAWHAPYHAALTAQITRIHARHGVVIVYDCHSIRSEIPFLFSGRLPDFNIGTDEGATCAPVVEATVLGGVRAAGRSYAVNGRFKGGWTTRHYGRPEDGVHAVQMELAQSTYLEEERPPWTYDPERADDLRDYLRAILVNLEDLAPTLGASDD